MYLDLPRLNHYVSMKISLFTLEAVADIAAKEARCFTVLDAMKLYHQCPLNV